MRCAEAWPAALPALDSACKGKGYWHSVRRQCGPAVQVLLRQPSPGHALLPDHARVFELIPGRACEAAPAPPMPPADARGAPDVLSRVCRRHQRWCPGANLRPGGWPLAARARHGTTGPDRRVPAPVEHALTAFSPTRLTTGLVVDPWLRVHGTNGTILCVGDAAVTHQARAWEPPGMGGTQGRADPSRSCAAADIGTRRPHWPAVQLPLGLACSPPLELCFRCRRRR